MLQLNNYPSFNQHICQLKPHVHPQPYYQPSLLIKSTLHLVPNDNKHTRDSHHKWIIPSSIIHHPRPRFQHHPDGPEWYTTIFSPTETTILGVRAIFLALLGALDNNLLMLSLLLIPRIQALSTTPFIISLCTSDLLFSIRTSCGYSEWGDVGDILG